MYKLCETDIYSQYILNGDTVRKHTSIQ